MNQALARHIGKRLRARRRLLDLTQAALGARCGHSYQTIHKYETGAVQISAAALHALALALQTSTNYFFDGFERIGGRPTDAPLGPGATA